ncbi:unnamed protein product [Rhizophagus irregularis]|nr:unnamed protein product [Rhizophagus irregularis]
MTSSNETRFESSNNDPFRRDDIPISMINFGKKSQLVMENFKKCCEEFKFDNSEKMTSIAQVVKEQRKIFREFAEVSIKYSDNLLDYSIDLLFFVDCFKDERYSDDEFLELLNDLLIKSRENHRLIKDLKKIISNKDTILGDVGINEKLTAVQNFLPTYIEEIKKCPGLINPDNISKIEEEITLLKNQAKSGIAFSAIGLVCIGVGLIAPPAGAVMAVSDVLLGISNGSNLYNSIKLIKTNKKIKDLTKKLSIEVDELIEKIKLFSNSLESIILEISTFEIFWENQVEKIDYLIKNLRGFNETERRHNKDKIVNSIEKKWKDVERECQLYSHEMKDLLIRDEYIKVKF